MQINRPVEPLAWMQCKEEASNGVSRTSKYGKRVAKLLTQQCAKKPAELHAPYASRLAGKRF